jgi:hypothetical protein
MISFEMINVSGCLLKRIEYLEVFLMETQYIARFYIDDTTEPYSQSSSNDFLSLLAQTSVFIEDKFAYAHCEIWDAIKNVLVTTMQRTQFG